MLMGDQMTTLTNINAHPPAAIAQGTHKGYPSILSSTRLQRLSLHFWLNIELPASNQAAFLVDVMFIFFTEEFDTACDGTGSGIAQRAERLATDVIADIHEQIDIALPAIAMLNAMENFGQPVGSFAARSAFTTGFIAVEFRHAQHGVNNARILVHHNDAA
jgi:hypothetical protein